MSREIVEMLYQQMVLDSLMTEEFPSDITVMYHGTANVWVADIAEQGLQPVDAHRWKATMELNGYNPNRDDDHGYVNLTSKLTVAQTYAETRVAYLRTKPGGIFMFNSYNLVKELDAPVIKNARPAVIEVKIDERIKDAISRDPNSPHWRVKGRIPSTLLKRLKLPKATLAASV
jgi:hypothetical protein